MRPIESVTPYHRNPRNNAPAVAAVAASIREFGWQQPIVVDAHGVIIIGHTRLLAAQALGQSEVPVRVAAELTPAQVKALRLADNRVGENAQWLEDLLALELADLQLADYDLTLTGFTLDDLDRVLAPPAPEGEDTADLTPPAVPVTRRGDIYTLGRHRLMCGNALELSDVEQLTEHTVPEMCYTDPPYGIAIVNTVGVVSPMRAPGPAFGGGVSPSKPFGTEANSSAASGASGTVGGGKPFGKVGTIHRGMKAKPFIEANTYAEIIGDDSTDTAIAAYRLVAAMKVPVQIFWGGNYYADALPPSSCWIVWDKDNGESFFADAELAWTNLTTAVRIFKHQWNGLLKASERGEKRVHPTQKPVALAAWCLERYGEKGDRVLDLFGGSGSTLIACENTARAALVMELSEAYCDVIIHRWETVTGLKAVLVTSAGAPVTAAPVPAGVS